MRMLKARQGESLTARSDAARDAELALMVLTHSLMVVIRMIREGFYRAFQAPLSSPFSVPSRARLTPEPLANN